MTLKLGAHGARSLAASMARNPIKDTARQAAERAWADLTGKARSQDRASATPAAAPTALELRRGRR